MSLSNFISILGLALLDSLNPATISTLIILMPLVKKRWHSLIFIAGTFLVYFISGILVYAGISQILSEVLSNLMTTYATLLNTLKLLLAIGLLLSGAIKSIQLIQQFLAKQVVVPDYMGAVVKSVTPWSILILALASTSADLPTALPYFGVVAILNTIQLSNLHAIGIFALYCLIYVGPMIFLYAAFCAVSDTRLQRIENTFRNFINKTSYYSIPLILLGLGLWLLL